MRKAIETRRVGFTLIELLVVIAIIGLLVSLILVAAADGVRRAEERATQALITKLEGALNDRLDALLNTQPPINQSHRFLASINYSHNGAYVPVGSTTSNSDDRRAQIIAQFDYLRAELPDVFFLNQATTDGTSVASSYPLNFAAAPYPSGTNSLTNSISGNVDGGSFVLPLGNNYPGLPFIADINNNPILAITQPQLPTTGMFGASFSAAGGIYKNLGYTPRGYDGIDNNSNGLIDDMAEGLPAGTTLQDFQAQVNTKLANHTHKTARSEMLYAILVEGLSPLGSAFSREDFTSREVQDTDGDGLPEFIDAWGEPIQFFRWPIYYSGVRTNASRLVPNPIPLLTYILGTSDSQLGSFYYTDPSQTREQDPLDPNQLLVAPGWWAGAANVSTTFAQFLESPPNGTTTNQSSPGAVSFMNHFHSLVDPNYASGQVNSSVWDRGGNFNRREYFSKFLILSSGPDKEPGVAQFNKDYSALSDSLPAPLASPYGVTFPAGTMEFSAHLLIYIENQAGVCDPVFRTSSGASFYEVNDSLSSTATAATLFLSGTANSDDITNHNISGISTGVR